MFFRLYGSNELRITTLDILSIIAFIRISHQDKKDGIFSVVQWLRAMCAYLTNFSIDGDKIPYIRLLVFEPADSRLRGEHIWFSFYCAIE